MTESYHDQTLDQLVDEAIGFEMQAARVYAALSKLFAHFPDISVIWDQMHSDELFHADVLQNLKTELPYERLSDSVGEAVWKQIVSVHQLLGEVSISRIANLSDAYELAHQLEHSEVNTIFRFLLEIDPSAESRQAILFNVLEHLDRLYALGRSFRGKVPMRQISAQRSSS